MTTIFALSGGDATDTVASGVAVVLSDTMVIVDCVGEMATRGLARWLTAGLDRWMTAG